MTEHALFEGLLHGSLVLAVITAVYLCFATAPYGRHARKGYGLAIANGLGWTVMEAPAALLPLVLTLLSDRRTLLNWVFLAIWESHYLYRAFVYPLRIRGRGAPMPWLIPLAGASFNLLNGYLNFRYLSLFGPVYAPSWLSDPRFLVGTLLFAAGLLVNRHADRVLLSLRAPGDTSYKIPRGWLYDYISCPNYFGEMVQWAGWALLTWSLPGLFFALFTAANLLPRALSHHRDYRHRFPHYPAERRAVFPFVL